MLRTLAIAGYRSLRDVRLSLDRLTVVTGANGSGKSSLYRALRLMTDVAHDRVIAALAAEGGLDSTLWAGPEGFSRAMLAGEQPVQGTRRSRPVALRLGFGGDDHGYAIDIGLPIPSATAFAHDPVIKVESLWVGARLDRHTLVAERRGALARVRARDGRWATVHDALAPWDSLLTQAADPREGLELLQLREAMRRWRFYDHLDSGRDAPARRPQVGTRTPVLAPDGADLAAALQTIREVGDGDLLDRAVRDAFAEARVEVTWREGWGEVAMVQPGLLRPLGVRELSDGTLRYLLLAAALLSPRPPALLVLNEPETSLHQALLAPLARLIVAAAERTQVIVVTHAAPLVRALAEDAPCRQLTLTKRLGETLVEDASGEAPPAWTWPGR